MKPAIRKLLNTGDYESYLISYKGNKLTQSFTLKWGAKLEQIHLAALKMKNEIDLLNVNNQ